MESEEIKRGHMKKILVSFLIIFLPMILSAQDAGGGSSNGLVLKGGLFGLGGSFKSELEDKLFITDIIGTNTGGRLNTSWDSTNKLYLLNPLGFDYYKSMGSGSLLLGLEMRGLPFNNLLGFQNNYDYYSIGAFSNNNGLGGLGIMSMTHKFSNQDFRVGYQLTFGQFSVTPMFLLRRFQSSYEGNGLFTNPGVEKYKLNSTTYSGFLGADLLYKFNAQSSVFFNIAFQSPILGDIMADGNRSYYFVGPNYGVFSLGNGSAQAQIGGNRYQIGYQHNFNEKLFLQVGYHTETLSVKYKGYSDLRISNTTNNDAWGFIIRNVIYGNSTNTEIKSLYLTINYKI